VSATGTRARTRFHVELIKPSHYDDDGYVIQWWKGWVPSSSLACLHGLARDAAERAVLGEDVEIVVNACDEVGAVVPEKRIIRRLARNPGIVCLVGVQTNQFPRAIDMARRFRAAGLQVVIGGFHVSGCLSMLPAMPDDLAEARELGISLFAGEAEGRLDAVLRDAYAGTLKPIYDYLADLPSLNGQVVPSLPDSMVATYAHSMASFDAGRGCPFECSFCTIINVQGRKSRWRDADDVERVVLGFLKQGKHRLFITDDNFARNRNWEAIFDRLAEIQAREGVRLKLIIQVDTLSHQIPKFVEKAQKAGVGRIFLGLESINPENLAAAKKRQNRIGEYRRLVQAWRDARIQIYAGYILGFPTDTPARIAQDIETIKRELAIDVLEFFCLTPLPGSEDHLRLLRAGVPMDPDMNLYDLEHVCTGHPKMSKAEWQRAYTDAWEQYFSDDHIEAMMRRMAASGRNPMRVVVHALEFLGTIRYERVHPLQGGYFRRTLRTRRRTGMALEPAIVFYPKRAASSLWKSARQAAFAARLWLMYRRVRRDPASLTYSDFATTPEPLLDQAPEHKQAPGTTAPKRPHAAAV